MNESNDSDDASKQQPANAPTEAELEQLLEAAINLHAIAVRTNHREHTKLGAEAIRQAAGVMANARAMRALEQVVIEVNNAVGTSTS